MYGDNSTTNVLWGGKRMIDYCLGCILYLKEKYKEEHKKEVYMKLYFITIRGRESFYVIAEDSEIAYRKVKKYLDETDRYFRDDREMKSIELLAEAKDYPDCKARLFL
jgi:hypothetical protein